MLDLTLPRLVDGRPWGCTCRSAGPESGDFAVADEDYLDQLYDVWMPRATPPQFWSKRMLFPAASSHPSRRAAGCTSFRRPKRFIKDPIKRMVLVLFAILTLYCIIPFLVSYSLGMWKLYHTGTCLVCPKIGGAPKWSFFGRTWHWYADKSSN